MDRVGAEHPPYDYARWSPTQRDPSEAHFMQMRRLLEDTVKK